MPPRPFFPQLNKVVLRPGQSPTVCLVQRQKTRRFRNYDALRRVALQEGFRVLDVVFEALRPRKIVQTMRRCDGLVRWRQILNATCQILELTGALAKRKEVWIL